jgi:hypothetical protein
MNFDSRYPNRKNPLEEPPRFDFDVNETETTRPTGMADSSEPHDPSGENEAEERLPLSGYQIIEPEQEAPPDKFVETDLQPPVAVIAQVEEKNVPDEPPVSRPPLLESWIGSIRRFAQSPTKVYTSASVSLGVLLGVVIAIFLWHTDKPEGPYDLGSSAYNAAGLKGHLFTKWEQKLDYRLTIEPDNADRAGFSLAVAHSPQPLSIEIHLQDDRGFVLCAKEIILKYDAGNAITPTVFITEAQEAAREKGKDVFLNQIGPDGQIASIYAQGDIPCSKKAYGSTFSWSFSTNFPSLSEQAALLKHQAQDQTEAARLTGVTLAAPRKRIVKSPVSLLSFSIEGDDAIVEFDTSRGVIETSARKIFFFDKASGAAADPGWQDYPVAIHYRCDQASKCVLMHEGMGTLSAVMKR